MQIIEKRIEELKEYENNPRHNESAVAAVAESISQFGFKVPIVIDADGVIIAGHTRRKAAERLGLGVVPCIVADDLTPEQIKAFRLADNKTGELASWDFAKLEQELAALGDMNMQDFGFYASTDDDAFADLFDEAQPEAKSKKEQQEGDEDGDDGFVRVVVFLESEEAAEQLVQELTEQGYDCEVQA